MESYIPYLSYSQGLFSGSSTESACDQVYSLIFPPKKDDILESFRILLQ